MKHFSDNIISFLKGAAVKLEEMQVQAALGKAELADKLEEIKKETKDKINHIKWDVNTEVEANTKKLEKVKTKIEHLRLQLALGKAETIEALAEQKKELKATFKEIKELLEKD